MNKNNSFSFPEDMVLTDKEWRFSSNTIIQKGVEANAEIGDSHLSEREQISYIKWIFSYWQPDSSFVYPGNAHLYKKMVEAPEYYPFHGEKKLLEQHAPTLHRFFWEYITDYGCGNGEKAKILLKDYSKPITYVAADYASDMIASAKSRLSKYQHIKTWQDFILDWKEFDIAKNLEDNIYLWLWITASNYPDYGLIKKIKNMWNNTWGKGNYVVLSFATEAKSSNDVEKRIAAYDNDPTRDFVNAWLKNLWLNPKDFKYKVSCDSIWNIQLGVVPQVDTILLPSGESLSIAKWAFYPFHTNRVFSRDAFKKLLKQAWASEKFFVEEDGVALIVAKKNPEKLEKHKNKIVKMTSTALLTLLWAGLFVAGGEYAKHQQKREKEEKIKLAEKKALDGKYISHGVYDRWMDRDMILNQWVEQAFYKTQQIIETALPFWECSLEEQKQIETLLKSVLRLSNEDWLMQANKVLSTKNGFFALDSATIFVQQFVKDYGPILVELWMKDLNFYTNLSDNVDCFSNTLSLDGEAVGMMATVNGVSRPFGANRFLADQSNTTKYMLENPPEYIIWTDIMKIFEENKYKFDFVKDLGQYRHSDWRLFQMVLLKKFASDEAGPFLFAADVTYKSEYDSPVLEYSLSLWKEVIENYLQYWNIPE